MKQNKERRVLFVVLPLIALLCLHLWYLRNYSRMDGMTCVQSENGVFDLTGAGLDTGLFRLEGDVPYIPGILTTEEFAAKENEAISGNPWYIPSATSRLRIRVPDERTYTLTVTSIDFAHRTYVNGELRFEAGVSAETAEDFVPGHAQQSVFRQTGGKVFYAMFPALPWQAAFRAEYLSLPTAAFIMNPFLKKNECHFR